MTSLRMAEHANGAFEKQSLRQRERAPKVARALVLLLVSFLFFALIWAAKTEMKELVRAEGEIAPEGELRRVDHFDGGVVAELYVKSGSVVAANAPLARISHPKLDEQIAEIEAELSALNKDIHNTRWLLDGEHAAGVSPIVEAQRRLFVARQSMLEGRMAKLTEAADVAAALRQNATERLSLSEASLARPQSLHDRGVVSEANLSLQVEEAANVRADLLRAEANFSRINLEALEAASARNEALLAFREEHLETLSQLERTRELATVKLNGLYAQKKRQIIRAPESGIIQSSSVTTIGESVPPGGLMFELLPSDVRLVAIVKIDPKDVGHISEGSKVAIKMDTFDARRYGDVRGAIELVSATSIVPDNGPAFYKAVLTLDSTTLGVGDFERDLRAGMTLVAEIETTKRTVIDYLLKPVRTAFDKSLLER